MKPENEKSKIEGSAPHAVKLSEKKESITMLKAMRQLPSKYKEYRCQYGNAYALFYLLSKIIENTLLVEVIWHKFIRKQTRFITEEPRYSIDEVIKALEAKSLVISNIEIEKYKFYEYLGKANYPYSYFGNENSQRSIDFYQNALNHFLSIQLLGISREAVLIDVASYHSPFPEIIKRLIGCRVYRQDIIYKKGIYGDAIGSDAVAIPLPSGCIDFITVHNSFQLFEGDKDTQFIKEAKRLLKPGGKLCVLPFHIGLNHYILTPFFTPHGCLRSDIGSKLIFQYRQRCRFERIYSAEAFVDRILKYAGGFYTEVIRIHRVRDVNPECQLDSALLFTRCL